MNLESQIDDINNLEKEADSIKLKRALLYRNINKIDSYLTLKKNSNIAILDDSKKSLDNLIIKNNIHGLKRFNTSKNIIGSYQMKKNTKLPSNYDNNFILAKKNILYRNNIDFNGQNDYLNQNDITDFKNDIFDKKIKTSYNGNMPNSKSYKRIIHKNKSHNTNYNNLDELFINIDNNNNNNEPNNTSAFNNISSNFHKKQSYNILYKFDFNKTMPNRNIKRSEIKFDNIKNSYKKDIIYKNENKQNVCENLDKRFSKNIKFTKQKLLSNKNTKNINEPKNKKEFENKKNDLSMYFDIKNNNKKENIHIDFFKKAESEEISKKFYSEKKSRNLQNIHYRNNEVITDQELDYLAEELELFKEKEKEDEKNRTTLLKETNISNDSDNLSDLAEDMVKLQNELESDDMMKQETVPSTSNPDVDGLFENSNNNNINMNNNNINYNIPFNNNKIMNSKPTIVNNFFISSPDMKNKNNKNLNDINYNLFVVNEYNNTNNNINNNIKNNINHKNNIKIPQLVMQTYKSPFNFGNRINEINNEDINEIEEIDENETFKENEHFKHLTDNNIKNNIIIDMNYINNNNNKKSSEKKLFTNNINNKSNFENQNLNNKNKRKSKNELNEIKSETNLRDLLSSHKNTPSNNQIQIMNENDFPKINNNFDDNNDIMFNSNKDTYMEDNKKISLDLENKNIYLSRKIDENKSINISPKKESPKKNKKHIMFNFDNNVCIKFKTGDLITISQISKNNNEYPYNPQKNMNLYYDELKNANPKPIIKKFSSSDIGINEEYNLVENLPERHILPDLYDDFVEEDIKSLEKSLEKSVDKIFH